MTPKERRDRLADFLEFEVQPMLDGATFDMELWGAADTGATLPESFDTIALSECGFAGCAAGWGYYCPDLRAEGLPVSKLMNGTLQSGIVELAEFFYGSHNPSTLRMARLVFLREYYPEERSPSVADVAFRLRAAE